MQALGILGICASLMSRMISLISATLRLTASNTFKACFRLKHVRAIARFCRSATLRVVCSPAMEALDEQPARGSGGRRDQHARSNGSTALRCKHGPPSPCEFTKGIALVERRRLAAAGASGTRRLHDCASQRSGAFLDVDHSALENFAPGSST